MDKDVITLSEIDLSLFKGHSTRSASTSRSMLSRASIQFLGKADGLVSTLGELPIKNL